MFPEVHLESGNLLSILNGQPVRISGQSLTGPVRLYGENRFVGLGEGQPEGEDAVKIVPRRLVASS
jgi:tRNA pseudouridine55 synthase